ncbi:MAG: prepilin-type N-terminal cleavage/methylation domain-containing protein [Phycisphaerales bacterium]|nr:prepilin-type N-terminal cleavage/methylation domain-containing protein [Phycisphaerales bacterium]
MRNGFQGFTPGVCTVNKRRQGFTLIELLVVIAIIALLISILLPALGRARKAGQMAVSLSNMRQINVAGVTYRDSNKGRMPLFVQLSKRGSTVVENPTGDTAAGWCTWSYGGKNNDGWWSSSADKFFDIEAADRPLNPYVYEGVDWEAPVAPAQLPKDSSARKQEAKVFKDPSDKVGHQRDWPKANKEGQTCYDDVGTSYQYNAKWFEQLPTSMKFVARFEFGIKRMGLADAFNPSKYAWMSDEYSDITVNQLSAKAQVKNGYDDINKSILGFLDGHAAYLTVYPGKKPESYTNDKYTFVFEDLRVPGT